MKLLFDATVLIDITLEDSARHSAARKTAEIVRARGWVPRIPFHTVVEISAVMNRHRKEGAKPKVFSGFGADQWFNTQGIPIDAQFMKEYFRPDLPYVKAGDYIYLCIAKKEAALLVTDDDKLQKAAKECGVDAIGVEEFVARFA